MKLKWMMVALAALFMARWAYADPLPEDVTLDGKSQADYVAIASGVGLSASDFGVQAEPLLYNGMSWDLAGYTSGWGGISYGSNPLQLKIDLNSRQHAGAFADGTYSLISGYDVEEHADVLVVLQSGSTLYMYAFENMDFSLLAGESLDGNWTLTIPGASGNPDGLFYVYTANYNPPLRPDTPGSVPEPATMLLFGAGMIGLAGAYRRKKNQ